MTDGVTNGSGWPIPTDEFGNPLRQLCFVGPNSPSDPESSTCPVLKFCRWTYWAYSYYDNRSSLALVAYDLDGTIVAQREEPGARYLWQITLDAANELATFSGQAGGTVVEPWSDLRPNI